MGERMELRHLRYFVAVAEERHITRAAARLGIQQPPLSQQIHALEAEIGGRLFRRVPRGVELTEAGHLLLAEAYEILAGVDRAGAIARTAAEGEVGALSVGFTTSAMLHPLVPDIIRAFRADFPRVSLDLQEGNAAELTERVHHGALQAGFLRVPVARPSGIRFLGLLDEELMVVLPVGHNLVPAPGHRLDLAALVDERFILVRRPSAPGIYANFVEACRQEGFEPKVVAEVGHMLTNINLVAAGVGISLVPAAMCEINLRQVVYAPIRQRPGLAAPLTLMFPERGSSPVLERFLALTRRLADGGTIAFGILQSGMVALHDAAPWLGGQPTGVVVPQEAVRLLAPVTPRNFVGLWNNFHAMAAKQGNAIPTEPLYFLKSTGSLLDPDGEIVPPPSYAGRTLYEGELGIVIGTRVHDADEATAAAAIFGYTCVNDVTALDLFGDPVFPQWARAKSCDTFGPVGPAIATGLDWKDLVIRTRLGGRERQNYPASDMILT
eukprot:gene5562-5617_t